MLAGVSGADRIPEQEAPTAASATAAIRKERLWTRSKPNGNGGSARASNRTAIRKTIGGMRPSVSSTQAVFIVWLLPIASPIAATMLIVQPMFQYSRRTARPCRRGSRGYLVGDATRSATKGLVARSWPKVDIGPWPGRRRCRRPSATAAGDRIDQVLVIAHREIGAADRALEQDVADDRELRFGMVEDDMAGRVAGAMATSKRQLADRHLVAVDQPAVGFERLAGDAVARAVLGEPGDPEAVVLVRALDLHAQLVGEDPGRSAMVDMAVGEQDLLDRHARLPSPPPSAGRGRRRDRRRRRASSWCTRSGSNSAAAASPG
jgi:hypothetical protein